MAQNQREQIYQRIQTHESHHSRKTLVVADEPSRYACGLCLAFGFGPRYNCRTCNIRIHRYCGSRLQNELHCFLHPDNHSMSLQVVTSGAFDCHVCGEDILGYHYKCGDPARGVRVHPICFALRHAPVDDATNQALKYTHWAHNKHPVQESFTVKRYLCDGCGTHGTGRRLRCMELECDFILHPYCFSSPNTQLCFLGGDDHQHGSIRRIVADSSSELQCRPCGGKIYQTEAGAGMYYWCEASQSAAHPLCIWLLQEERQFTPNEGENQDRVAEALRKALKVLGVAMRAKTAYTFLSSAAGGVASVATDFQNNFEATGDCSDAASSTAANVMNHAEEAASAAVEHAHQAAEGVFDILGHLLDIASNLF